MALAHLTTFEKAVIRIVDYLVETKDKHQKFRFKSDLLEELHLQLRDWSKYKKSERNIPDNEGDIPHGKHQHIRQYLINEFNINPGYLDGKSQQMFLKPLIADEERTATLDKPMMKLSNAGSIANDPDKMALQNRIAILEEYNRDLKLLVETQRKYIAELESKSIAKKTSDTTLSVG